MKTKQYRKGQEVTLTADWKHPRGLTLVRGTKGTVHRAIGRWTVGVTMQFPHDGAIRADVPLSHL